MHSENQLSKKKKTLKIMVTFIHSKNLHIYLKPSKVNNIEVYKTANETEGWRGLRE